jgi:hypothetical protein
VIHLRADGPSEYLPNLDEVTVQIAMVSFKQWWERDIIFKDSVVSLTRKRLVLALRNQDGGSHLDEELRDPGYVELAKASRTFVTRPGHAPQFLVEAESAIMRHVAWELIKTLVDAKSSDDALPDDEIARRMKKGIGRFLNTPPMPHGKNPKSPPPPKQRERRATKGRVHRAKSRSA